MSSVNCAQRFKRYLTAGVIAALLLALAAAAFVTYEGAYGSTPSATWKLAVPLDAAGAIHLLTYNDNLAMCDWYGDAVYLYSVASLTHRWGASGEPAVMPAGEKLVMTARAPAIIGDWMTVLSSTNVRAVDLSTGEHRDWSLADLPDTNQYPMFAAWDSAGEYLYTVAYSHRDWQAIELSCLRPSEKTQRVASLDLKEVRERLGVVPRPGVRLGIRGLSEAFGKLYLLLMRPGDPPITAGDSNPFDGPDKYPPPLAAAIIEVDPASLKQVGVIYIKNADTAPANRRALMNYFSSTIGPYGDKLQVKFGPTISILGPDGVERTFRSSEITYRPAVLVGDLLVQEVESPRYGGSSLEVRRTLPSEFTESRR